MAETSAGARPVDAQLWHVCAGAVTNLPQVGSSVVYFPQGHAEQVSGPPLLDLPRLAPAVSCKILCIEFLADSETDEAYARMRLQPVSRPWFDLHVDDEEVNDDRSLNDATFCEVKAMSFAKTLTQSDANNGGGFSIPRYCAETIFPRLDYAQCPPVQTVLAKDVHGTVWKFRHIYRGTPRRHLLTTGWSNFVNQKKLVAGDVIVFMRTNAGELCIGIRRAIRNAGQYRMPPKGGLSLGVDQNSPLAESCNPPSTLSMGVSNKSSTFSRHRSPVSSQSVLEAATAASLGQSFEILYYPRAITSEFCVKSFLVKRSLQRGWASGMRFKMAIETDDTSRTSWYMGTIWKVEEVDPIRWPKSPWKVLQVTWDEGVLQGIERVSPWQVDLVSPILPPLSLLRKKPRLLQAGDTQHEGPDNVTLPLVNFMSDYVHPWHDFTTHRYSSMEGARHKFSYGLADRDLAPTNWPWACAHHEQPLQLRAANRALNLGLVLSEGPGAQTRQLTTLTVGSSSNSEPDLSTLSCCDEGGSTSPKSTHFFLFGKAIDVTQPTRVQPLSSESALGGLGQETMSDGLQSELSLSAQGSSVETMENPHVHTQHGESLRPKF